MVPFAARRSCKQGGSLALIIPLWAGGGNFLEEKACRFEEKIAAAKEECSGVEGKMIGNLEEGAAVMKDGLQTPNVYCGFPGKIDKNFPTVHKLFISF